MSPRDDRDLLELVAFLLVSARNLIDEPPRYGPLRLVEASRRLIDTFERRGCSNDVLVSVSAAAADMSSLLMRSNEDFVDALDRLVVKVSSQLAISTQAASDAPQVQKRGTPRQPDDVD